MLGQIVAGIEQTGKGITIKTAEGNSFYIPNGVAVIPIGNSDINKMFKEMSESTIAESNRRFLEHATRKYPPNIICRHNILKDTIIANGVVREVEYDERQAYDILINGKIDVIKFDKLSREEKAELCDEAMLNDMSRHICDVCRLDRSICGYIPENPRNCEGYCHK